MEDEDLDEEDLEDEDEDDLDEDLDDDEEDEEDIDDEIEAAPQKVVKTNQPQVGSFFGNKPPGAPQVSKAPQQGNKPQYNQNKPDNRAQGQHQGGNKNFNKKPY